MVIKNKDGRIYVSGLENIVVVNSDEKTFELLKAIYSYNGPYRKVLKNFSIGNNKCQDDFIKLIDGKVFSDIDIENRSLWNSCMMAIKLKGDTAVFKLNLNPLGIIKGFKGFINKNLKEINIITHPEDTEKKIFKKYEEFSSKTKRFYLNKNINKVEFLKMYEFVVYIGYVYTIVFEYNYGKGIHKKFMDLFKKYNIENDYMLNERKVFESQFRPKESFSLDFNGMTLMDVDEELPWIPDILPIDYRLDVEDNDGVKILLFKLEKELEVIKNNLRLKTNVLLFLLSIAGK